MKPKRLDERWLLKSIFVQYQEPKMIFFKTKRSLNGTKKIVVTITSQKKYSFQYFCEKFLLSMMGFLR